MNSFHRYNLSRVQQMTCLTHTKAEIFRYIGIEFWTVGIEMMDCRALLKIAGGLRNCILADSTNAHVFRSEE